MLSPPKKQSIISSIQLYRYICKANAEKAWYRIWSSYEGKDLWAVRILVGDDSRLRNFLPREPGMELLEYSLYAM